MLICPMVRPRIGEYGRNRQYGTDVRFSAADGRRARRVREDRWPDTLRAPTIGRRRRSRWTVAAPGRRWCCCTGSAVGAGRSEEHTSELQSRGHLVCRLLLEKKNA